jgi:hypothetical protein
LHKQLSYIIEQKVNLKAVSPTWANGESTEVGCFSEFVNRPYPGIGNVLSPVFAKASVNNTHTDL